MKTRIQEKRLKKGVDKYYQEGISWNAISSGKICLRYLGDYTLLCTFNDGVTKKVDLQPLLKYPAFAELKDKKKFVQFGLDQTIFWYNGADIAPEYLYDNGVMA